MRNQNNEINGAVAIVGQGMGFQFKKELLHNLISNGGDVIITDPAHEMNKPLSDDKSWLEPCKTVRKHKIGKCIVFENVEELEGLIKNNKNVSNNRSM